MTSTSGPPTATRYRELDALRGFAAVGIILWHYRAHFGVVPLVHVLEPFYRAGYYAVDFFFVLSGTVLAKAYLAEPRRRDFTGNMVRRLARIYPLHFVTLIATALLQFTLVDVMHGRAFLAEYNDAYHFVLNLALSNFVGFQRGFSFNAPSWSISTELYANVLFFLLIASGRRLNGVFAGLVFVSGVLLTGLGDGRIDRADTIFHVQVSLVRTIFGFFTGVLLHEWVLRKESFLPRWIADLLFVLTLIALWLAPEGHLGFFAWGQVATVLIAFPLLIVTAVRGSLAGSCLRWKPLTWLGDVSYSLYLIHFPLLVLVEILITARLVAIDLARPLTLVVFLSLCVALAGLSHRYIESPAQATINSWWRRRHSA